MAYRRTNSENNLERSAEDELDLKSDSLWNGDSEKNLVEPQASNQTIYKGHIHQYCEQLLN